MPFWRKDEETLDEQLLREAGLGGTSEKPQQQPEPPPGPYDPYAGTYPAQSWAGAIWSRAMARPAAADVYTTAEAPQVAGEMVAFATLANGDVIVDEEQGDADLGPLADAVEQHLQPPYRAVGKRESGALWAVAARRIEILTLSVQHGDEIELVVREGTRTLTVDGAPSDLELPALERALEVRSADYVVHAARLDGDAWEIVVEAL